MPSFAGYTLPDELRMLAEQIRRFVQEEIIPPSSGWIPTPRTSPTTTTSASPT